MPLIDAPKHTCQDATARGLSAGQATDFCPRCQFLLAAVIPGSQQ